MKTLAVPYPTALLMLIWNKQSYCRSYSIVSCFVYWLIKEPWNSGRFTLRPHCCWPLDVLMPHLWNTHQVGEVHLQNTTMVHIRKVASASPWNTEASSSPLQTVPFHSPIQSLFDTQLPLWRVQITAETWTTQTQTTVWAFPSFRQRWPSHSPGTTPNPVVLSWGLVSIPAGK